MSRTPTSALAIWGLPYTIVDAVQFHHNPGDATEASRRLASLFTSPIPPPCGMVVLVLVDESSAVMSKLILLVEDNSGDEKLTLLAFRRSGVPCEFVVTRDGAETLDYLFATGQHQSRDLMMQPVLVLLDLNLPRVSGLDVLRRLRAAPMTRSLPVIILSSSCLDEDMNAAYSLGANAYVRKPIDFAEFLEAARAILAFWLRYNELPPRKMRR